MDLRRQHRIIYQTKIRMRAPGQDDSVVARVQNLSARGMFVTASDLPAEGAEVQCLLTLGGERRTVRGRVAWVRPSSASTPLKSPGAGIEFIDLDKHVSDLLGRLVEPDDGRKQVVDVWFEGMAAPIRCHAAMVGEGLRIETRLPFMRLSSSVRVAFSAPSPLSTREGIVDGVSLEPSQDDGVPLLRVAVTLPPLDSARGTIESPVLDGDATLQDPVVPLGSTLVDPAVIRPGNGRSLSMHDAPVVVSVRDESENTHRISVAEVVGPDDAVAAAGGAADAGERPAQEAPTGWRRIVAAAATRGGRFAYLLVGVAVGAALVRALVPREPAGPAHSAGVAMASAPAASAPSAAAAGAAPATPTPPAGAAAPGDNSGSPTAAVPPAGVAAAPSVAAAGEPPLVAGAPAQPAAAASALPTSDPALPAGDPAQAPNAVAGAASPGLEPAPAAAAGPEIEPLAPPSLAAVGAVAADTVAAAAAVAGSPSPAVAAPTETAGVSVINAGDETTITVPLEGSTERAFTRVIDYGERGVLGVALLRARPVDSIGVGVIKPAGSPARVLIRRRGQGSLVRFAFDVRRYQGKITQDGDALRLTIARRRH